jgi:hypothetical protein
MPLSIPDIEEASCFRVVSILAAYVGDSGF